MVKKASLTMIVLLLILTLASITVLAQPGPAKGGPPGGGEDPPEIPDTGELYGDLYVILRDVNGVPVLARQTFTIPESEEGPATEVTVACKQLIANPDESLYVGGSTTFVSDFYSLTIYPGEPFAPPSYLDAENALVECELTEDMLPYVQSVDFGRLNLGRAPDAVINHAFDEAINKFNAACDMTLDPAGRIMYAFEDLETENCDNWLTIDSPAENLALYIKMLKDGHWITLDTSSPTKGSGGKNRPPDDGPSTEPRPVLSPEAAALIQGIYADVYMPGDYDPETGLYADGTDGYINLGDQTKKVADLGSEDLLLAASLLAAAGDKTGTFTIDKVAYINAIYGIENLSVVDPAPSMIFGGYQYGVGGYQGRGACGYRGSEICGERNLGLMNVLELTGGIAGELGSTYTSSCLSIETTVKFSDDPSYLINPFVEVYETVGLFLYTEGGTQKLYTAANAGTFDLTINGTLVTGIPFDAESSVFGEGVTGTGTQNDPWVIPSGVVVVITDDTALSFVGDFTTNIRAFANAADDALQVLEYIHNYRVPEDIYAP